jgi:ribosomal protein S18 acetylase RimI-like enzyme
MTEGIYQNFIHDKYGYCYYDFSPDKTPLIYNLWVEPKDRRQGHAKRLLQYVINEIRKTGYQGEIKIEANPREDNIDKSKLTMFYENLGLSIF